MSKPVNFEKSMTELQTIVTQLEKGELSLEESLKQFEKGITIARQCQNVLNQAEQKIELLSAIKTPLNEASLGEAILDKAILDSKHDE